MKGEKGFTITELLIGMIIMAIVVLAASMSIGQMYRITRLNNDWSIAVRQAQNAGYWLSHDAIMSIDIMGDNNLTSESGNFTLEWIEWDTGNINFINYSLIPSPDGLYRLKRIKTVEFNGTVILTAESVIADHIESIRWSPVGDDLHFTTEAVSRSKSATREYVVSPRVKSN